MEYASPDVSYSFRLWYVRVKSCSELELSSAEKWGDDGGIRSVMPARGIERLCWLRAVVATSSDSFLPSRRVPVSLSPCLSISPFVRRRVFTYNLHINFLVLPVLFYSLCGYVCGLLSYSSLRPRFSLVLLCVYFSGVSMHMLCFY